MKRQIYLFDNTGNLLATHGASHIDVTKHQSIFYLNDLRARTSEQSIFRTMDEVEAIETREQKIIIHYLSGGTIVIC